MTHESTALATREAAPVGAVSAIQRLDPQQINVIKQTVAKGASDVELAMFLELAQRYQLDPFAREIWCVDMGGGGKTIMAGRDGYLAIANRHPAFDGLESDVVREGDTFERDGSGVRHSYGAKRGAILGAYALVHRTDRSRPAYFFAPFAEYNSTKSAWKSYPSAMIIKVAEAMALKRAFSISGLVTQEEMDKSERAPRATAGPVEPTPPPRDSGDLDAAVTGPDRFEALTAHAVATGVVLNWSDFGVAAQNDLADDEIYAKVRQHITGDGPAEEGEIIDPSEPQLPGTEAAGHRDPQAAS